MERKGEGEDNWEKFCPNEDIHNLKKENHFTIFRMSVQAFYFQHQLIHDAHIDLSLCFTVRLFIAFSCYVNFSSRTIFNSWEHNGAHERHSSVSQDFAVANRAAEGSNRINFLTCTDECAAGDLHSKARAGFIVKPFRRE